MLSKADCRDNHNNKAITSSGQNWLQIEFMSCHSMSSKADCMDKDNNKALTLTDKLGAIVYIFPNFQNCVRCEKDLKDNKHNSLHLGRKYARIFVLRNSWLSVPRSSQWTNNVRGQISWHIFAPNGGYCSYIASICCDRLAGALSFRSWTPGSREERTQLK